MALNCLPKRKRLAEHEVRTVLRCGRRVVDPHFELKFMARVGARGPADGRLAIAVPKRKLKHAVARNRIKRLIRESFRLHRISGAPQDILVTYRSGREARFGSERSDLRSQLEALFSAALSMVGSRGAEGPAA